jgi:hypothetical protein
MTLQPATGHEATDARETGRPSRKDVLYFLLALLPLSALLVFVVLQVMAANSAAATGGCGGG